MAASSQGSPGTGPLAVAPVDPARPPRPTLRREWLLLTVALLLLAGILLPPLINLGRYQHRIADAMSRSLGRPVAMRAVTLRLFPAPALVLSDVTVYEQPGFGAEPALRAPSLIAELRLTSLWRGQFEVSRIDLSDASLNLVRSSEGHWNIGSILLQASHVPNAPTGQRRAGAAPRFPYIAITDSRINLKIGDEKLPYSLLNANVAMWLAAPELWQIKLEAQPVRTDIDLGLSDTGLLRVEGTLHRAVVDQAAKGFAHMPLTLHLDWANAPLGQATRLLLASDLGWRGEMHVTADVAGELDELQLKTHLVVANLHRQEFTPPEPFTVDTSCRAAYSRRTRSLSDLACRWPVSDGQFVLTGFLSPSPDGRFADGGGDQTRPQDPASKLTLRADQVPASFFLAAAGLLRSDFAPAFRLRGAFSGQLAYTRAAGLPGAYAGLLESPELSLSANGLDRPLAFPEVRLGPALPAPTGVGTLLLTSAPIDLGGSSLAAANVQLTTQGLLLHASGRAAVDRLLSISRACGLLPSALARLADKGTAEFNLTRVAGWQLGGSGGMGTRNGEQTVAGGWVPAMPVSRDGVGGSQSVTDAVTTGWLRLEGAEYRPGFLRQPVSLPVAQATFLPGEIAWTVPAAQFDHTRLQIAASYPLRCEAGGAPCLIRFRIATPLLDAAELEDQIMGEGRLLNQLMDRIERSGEGWPALTGTIHADSLTLGQASLRNADATLTVSDRGAKIDSLDAQALGGALHGSGTIVLEGGTARYALSVALTRASIPAVAGLFHESWGPGALNLTSELTLSGSGASELAGSAGGRFQAEWLRGGLGGPTRLGRFARWAGDGVIEDRKVTLAHSELAQGVGGVKAPTSSGAPSQVKGSIGFDRALTLIVSDPEDASGFVPVTGTLAHPAAGVTLQTAR